MEGQSILMRPDTHRSLLRKSAFSLVEMLMALLVASLLLAALAPVMTKKFSENVNVTGSMGSYTTKQKTKEIEFGSEECSEIKTDSDGSQYCEGEYTVKGGFNGYINVTVIGAGGGGGTAPTAGFVEYTTAGNTNTFTVPAMTGDIEATLISGGAGGGAGGQVSINKDWLQSVEENWTVPKELKNKNALVTACGGGGGGGGGLGSWCPGNCLNGGGGGSGGYVANRLYTINSNTISVIIGGQGGRGSHGHQEYPFNGGFTECGIGSGAGGGDYITNASQVQSCSSKGGRGGSSQDGPVRLYASGGIMTNGASSVFGNYIADGGVDSAYPYHVTTSAGNFSGGSGRYDGYWHGGDGGGAYFPGSGQVGTGGGGGDYGGGGGGASAAGGGGGGGGPTYFNGELIAAGGGGGGGIAASTGNFVQISGAGGGGGGGYGGGNGGNGGIPSPYQGAGQPGKGGLGGVDGVGAAGGVISGSPFPNNCSGGNGAATGGTTGTPGKTGALRVTYLSYGPGGSGGGGASIVPLRPVKVNASDTLNIIIGKGGTGGTPGLMNSSGATIAPVRGNNTGMSTYLKNSSGNNLLHAYGGDNWCPLSGDASGQIYTWGQSVGYGHPGGIYNGVIFGGMPGEPNHLSIPGFSNSGGKSAGNKNQTGNITYPNGSTGGDGGTATTPFTGTCTPGKGGTSSNPAGGNATGYGCGGGGGYGLANGGAGSGGYARISWNKYWDTANSAYKLAETGAGGGGASGNVFTYSIPVKSNEIIKFRIGKGGNGAYVSNNTVIEAAKGGDTVFGDVKAGGGLGGKSVSINSGVLVNGAGGEVSGTCHYKTTSYINNNKKCIKGIKGSDAIGAAGGKGADFTTFTYTVIDKDGNETKKEVKGGGGDGGIQGDNNNGKDAGHEALYASGGGGAAIRDLGQVSTASQTNITKNETKGGAGSNGKIILEWYE